MLVFTGSNSYRLPGWRGIGTSAVWVSRAAIEPAGPIGTGRVASVRRLPVLDHSRTGTDPLYWRHPRGVVLPHPWGTATVWLGLGATPSTLVNAIAAAIAQEEGYNSAGTIAALQNNPGCLRSGPGQIGTANGYAVFPDANTGWAALDSQVNYNIGLGLNLQQFFAGLPGTYPGYAPSADSNNPAAYAAFVGQQVGIDTTTPLTQLQGSYDSINSTAAAMVSGDSSTAWADIGAAESTAASWLDSLAAVTGLDSTTLGIALGLLGVGLLVAVG